MYTSCQDVLYATTSHTYMYIRMCVNIRHIRICTYVCMYIYVAYVHVHTHVCTLCENVTYVHVHTYVCTYTSHTYTYTRMWCSTWQRYRRLVSTGDAPLPRRCYVCVYVYTYLCLYACIHMVGSLPFSRTHTHALMHMLMIQHACLH